MTRSLDSHTAEWFRHPCSFMAGMGWKAPRVAAC